MMDADTINNGIRQERLDAYENIVSIDSALGNYKEALAFQQKIIDYHQKVYNSELARQLDEIFTKFDVEKKNLELQNMKEREEQRTVIFRLLIGSLVAAAVILVFVVWIYILHRCCLLDWLYQAALESEMNLQKLETVKIQYSNLKDSLESRQVSRNFEIMIENATIFNVEPVSVYTVRYRLRKKFRKILYFSFS